LRDERTTQHNNNNPKPIISLKITFIQPARRARERNSHSATQQERTENRKVFLSISTNIILLALAIQSYFYDSSASSFQVARKRIYGYMFLKMYSEWDDEFGESQALYCFGIGRKSYANSRVPSELNRQNVEKGF